MSRFLVKENDPRGSERDFRVDDGLRVLYTCPCCGLHFSERGAQVVADKLNSGELTWEGAQQMILLQGGPLNPPQP